MFEEDKLRAFGRLVVKLQQREDLTREETREAYRQIWRNEQPELQQGAFIAALKCKGETRDELVGVAEAFGEEWEKYFPHKVRAEHPHLGICGVGMDSLKTVNISSGASVIAAACGVPVYKVSAPALTGVSGGADAFALWGVDIDVPGEESVRATEQCRLGTTSLVSRAMMASGIARVVSQIRIGTSFHISGPMAVHAGEQHKVMGVPHPSMTRLCVEVMRGLGYKGAIVPCGASREHPGRYLDELSTIGISHVAELHEDGSVTEYEITPDDVGIPEARYEDIASTQSREENARIVARTLAGKGSQAVLDILALNAAACLKVMGRVPSLVDGVRQARVAVEDGRAMAQLRSLIETQNHDPKAGLATLDALIGS
jgi:anthranilate phosphoribosyltransferase